MKKTFQVDKLIYTYSSELFLLSGRSFKSVREFSNNDDLKYCRSAMDSKSPNNIIFEEEVDNKLTEHAACETEIARAPQLLHGRFKVRMLEVDTDKLFHEFFHV
jgi:hypothetical protein